MVTVLPTDELILASRAELGRWDAYNNQLYSVLFLSIKGAVNGFLICFARRPNSGQQPDGQVAWEAMAEKDLSSIMQRRRILMRKLTGMVMRPNQDLDEYLTEVFQQRDELEHISESCTEAHIFSFILQHLSGEYDPVRFTAERDPEISPKEIGNTMRNMYANRVTRGDDWMFPRGKGRNSAMTASSGMKESCNFCNKSGLKKVQCSKFLRESSGEPLPSTGVGRSSWCSCITRTLTTTTTAAPSSTSVAMTGGGGYTRSNNNSGNDNRHRHGGDFNSGRVSTAVTANGMSSPTVIAPASAAPVTA